MHVHVLPCLKIHQCTRVLFLFCVYLRPAYMDEYEKLEEDLQKMYGEYMSKFRNQAYLETLMEEYHQQEQTKSEVSSGRTSQVSCTDARFLVLFCRILDSICGSCRRRLLRRRRQWRRWHLRSTVMTNSVRERTSYFLSKVKITRPQQITLSKFEHI